MSITFTEKTFSYTCATSGASINDRVAFMDSIAQYMINTMGIPILKLYSTTASTSVGHAWYCVGWGDVVTNNRRVFELAINTSNYLTIGATNVSVSTVSMSPSIYVYKNSTTLQITLRWIKSGNCWFFGFAPTGYSDSYDGWINCAIVPVRSVNNPDAIVSYGLVFQNATQICKNVALENNNTVYDKYRGYGTRLELRSVFPANGESSLIKAPIFMNVNDYYFEGVYISNLVGNSAQETVVTTEDGTFLVASSGYGQTIDGTYPSLIFDVTEVAT